MPQKATKPMNVQLVFSEQDRTIMASEGWDVIEAGVRGPEIQRADESRAFQSDKDALEHVMQQALAGSYLHVRALVAHCVGREANLEELLHAVTDTTRNDLVLRTVIAFSDPLAHGLFQDGLTSAQNAALRDLNADRIDSGDVRDSRDFMLDADGRFVEKQA